ncbi:MAG: hypothetical protein NVSMB12_09480 [Acidimicrobiales bacterium]
MAVCIHVGKERDERSAAVTPIHASSASGLPHQRGLDGLRGIAVLAVLAYHLGWLPGGFLGVSLFFTLSGFLITNLLLREAAGSGDTRHRSIGLAAFWARRARRLLPAALAGIALAVAVTAAVGSPDQLRALPGDVIGGLAYGANWRFVLAHNSYRSGFAGPSPLLHYWSLAIEEQLYVVVPLLVAVVTLGRGRPRRRLAAIVGLGMGASAAATLWFGAGHADRIYFGTDTRMFELLAGALLAIAVGFPGGAHDRLRNLRAIGPVTVLAAVAAVALWAGSHQQDIWLYRGGLWAVSAVSCVLIVGACWGRTLRRVLTLPPLPAAGRISYGLYVYHWPLFVAIDTAHTGLHGVGLGVTRLAATTAVAVVSFRWLEQPIRTRRTRISPALRAGAPLAMAALVVAAALTAGLAASRSIAPARSRGLLLAGVTNPAAPVTIAPPPAPLHRVLFLGDSLVQQAYPTFADRLRRQGIDARVAGGNGQSLMTHDRAWLSELDATVAAWDPDVVVLESCCGQFRFDPPLTGADGRPTAPASPEFDAAWRTLAIRASQIASARGALVLWVLGPPTHTNGWYGPIDGQVAGINAVYRGLVSCPARTGTIDWGTVGGPGGTYADALPDAAGHLVPIRQADGFHFTPAGIDALSDLTLDAVTRAWQDGGRTGPWPAVCP